MGGKEEGLSGACIKDTWTKPKRDRINSGEWGWCGGGVEGGNGDNCTSAAIKKVLKRKFMSIRIMMRRGRRVTTTGDPS